MGLGGILRVNISFYCFRNVSNIVVVGASLVGMVGAAFGVSGFVLVSRLGVMGTG